MEEFFAEKLKERNIKALQMTTATQEIKIKAGVKIFTTVPSLGDLCIVFKLYTLGRNFTFGEIAFIKISMTPLLVP